MAENTTLNSSLNSPLNSTKTNVAQGKKRGLLLLNLGTPDRPEPEDVGRYLKLFLMDKWVIDSPYPLRWFLVNVLIVPKRKYASSEAYKTIWTSRGSPLLFHLHDLHEKVKPLVPDMETAIGMRYGNPSIESGLKELEAKNVDEIIVFPLYPQYAESSTRSSREECERVARENGFKARLRFVQDYYDHPGYISAFAGVVSDEIKNEAAEVNEPDHYLMSFHGLPEHHVQQTDPTSQHCLKSPNCCDRIVDANRLCYRAQSYATARALAKQLGLRPDQYTVSFQSRLGRRPWIKPFTDVVLPELAKKGFKRIAVVCPSFTADCLETIEEIGERGAHDFKSAGGEVLQRISCLNSDDRWARAIPQIISDCLT